VLIHALAVSARTHVVGKSNAHASMANVVGRLFEGNVSEQTTNKFKENSTYGSGYSEINGTGNNKVFAFTLSDSKHGGGHSDNQGEN
jgi:hypothetical protein